jgi:hypothetical protein
MGKKFVKVKDCDRCPTNRQVPATGTFRFSFREHHWEIDLCDKHLKDIERDMYAWARLGREVEQTGLGRMFGSEYHMTARRTAELRTSQSAEDRSRDEEKAAITSAAKRGGELLRESVTGPRPAAPNDADAYVFTEHALTRLAERQVRAIDALWAASDPTIVREARQPGLAVHERNGVKVVLNPNTKAIITVAMVDPHRKAI